MRTEKDSMGIVQVPDNAYYGAQTQRAVENFPISGITLSKSMIQAIGLVKRSAAVINNKLGILEPTKNCINYTSGINVDLVIVPGIVWNHSGHRIGYGSGYYDKYINLLNKNINTVGLSYEFQIFANIPTEKYDMSVNKLVTENQIIYCKRRC